jgi:hypothetical protein
VVGNPSPSARACGIGRAGGRAGLFRPPIVTLALLAGTLLLSPAAGAAPNAAEPSEPPARGPTSSVEVDGCIESFGSAQRLRREGKLVASRAELVRCAQANCPAPIRERCVAWLGDVDRSIPTVIVTAVDPTGQDTSDVRVWLDGALRTAELDGRPWPVDPGQHLLRFEHEGARPIERRVILAETEKNRRIELWFERSAPAPPQPVAAPAAPRTDAAQIVTWTAVGVGAAALVVGVVTGGIALDERAGLDERCPAGSCSWDELERYRDAVTLARVSTLAFIGAGAGLSIGLLTQLLAGDSPTQASGERTANAVRRPVGLRIGVGQLFLEGRWP